MSASKYQDLPRRLAPAAEVLLQIIEDDSIPVEVFEPLGTSLLIIADVAEDAALGLIAARPEVRASYRKHNSPVTKITPIFREELCTPYVLKIYSNELGNVRGTSSNRQSRQLSQSAYILSRIVASGALLDAHVRESLRAAAHHMDPEHALRVIERAFQQGLGEPRTISVTRAQS